MEARGWSRRELEACIGSRARVSEILSRKRSLTLEMIRKLHEQLGIPADVLIRPYESLQAPA
jgi:HTH-type transcriptional regulator / antitoxin HigA